MGKGGDQVCLYFFIFLSQFLLPGVGGLFLQRQTRVKRSCAGARHHGGRGLVSLGSIVGGLCGLILSSKFGLVCGKVFLVIC